MDQQLDQYANISVEATAFYSGLRFLVWDDIEEYKSWISRETFCYYTLQYHHQGILKHQLGSHRMHVYEGPHAWVTGPGHTCNYGSPEGSSRHHIYASFMGPRVDSYVNSGLITLGDGSRIFPITRPERFYADMMELFKCMGPDVGPFSNLSNPTERSAAITKEALLHPLELPMFNHPRAVHLLEGLLLQMHQQPDINPVGSWTPVLRNIAWEIRRNPGINWDFKELVQELNISLTHFRRIFPQCLGMPPERYLRECRLELAARLLRDTALPMAKIAEQVGINDIYHFGKLFKQHHHVAPGHYRRGFDN